MELFDDTTKQRYRSAGIWRESTFVDDVLSRAAAHPDKTAIVGYRAGAEAADEVTYGQLEQLVNRCAGALIRLGVGPGDVVALQLPNWWQFPVVALAANRVGAVVNPLVAIFRERELRFILERTAAKLCVVPDTFRNFGHGELLRRLATEIPTLERAVVIGEDFEQLFLDASHEDAPELPALLAERRLGPDDLAEVQFTSGTTGEPKGVQHTPNTLWSAVEAARRTLELGPDDVVLMASTLAHQTGFLYGFVMPLAHGMTVVYQDVWDGTAGVGIMSERQVTFTIGATPFVADSVAAQQRAPQDLTPLRYFVCGGAPIPPHLVTAADEELGCELVAVWGMTENGVVTITRPGDPPEVVADSDGTPVDWMEVRVVDAEGVEVPVDAVGRLLCRGANQTPGYFKRADLYAEALVADPAGGPDWFETGDLARRRGDGGIRIAGRVKDLIIRGGENVPAVEVEAVLYTHPKVSECAVVGFSDERLGERACAVVVPADLDDPPTLEELVDHCRDASMARQYWPERLEITKEMPKTPSGKIQKFRLREEIAPAT